LVYWKYETGFLHVSFPVLSLPTNYTRQQAVNKLCSHRLSQVVKKFKTNC
jgi:hypothetical protein